MQTKLPNNFPPCPMCRAPITRAIRDIDLMEPARAEEDIIEFVRPYENCDLCKKRERPTLRCLECSGLICENCQLVHGKLQSHHTVVSIFESGVVVQRPVIKNECKTHPNQTLDLYCLMCSTMLCLYCDKYSHSSCSSSYEEFVNYIQKFNNSSQLLQDFVFSSEERKNLIQTLEIKEQRKRTERTAQFERSFAMLQTPTSTTFRTMSPADQAMARMQNLTSQRGFSNSSVSTPPSLRVVQVNEFSAFARNFIREITEEVEKDIEFYEEYIGRLTNIIGSETESPELNERKGNLETEMRELIKTGKKISKNNKLMDRSTDVEVAESALRKEIASLQFFRFRKPYSMDVRCIEITLDKLYNMKPSIRQRALCAIKDHVQTEVVCLFIDRVEVAVDLLQDNHSVDMNGETEKPQTLDDTDTDGKGGAYQIVSAENKLVFNTIRCLDVENSYEYSGGYSHCETALIANILYENRFFGNANRLQLLIKGGLSIDVKTINKTGFTGNSYTKAIEKKCLDRCKHSKKRSLVNIVTSAGP